VVCGKGGGRVRVVGKPGGLRNTMEAMLRRLRFHFHGRVCVLNLGINVSVGRRVPFHMAVSFHPSCSLSVLSVVEIVTIRYE
jgi:hypothetical protein